MLQVGSSYEDPDMGFSGRTFEDNATGERHFTIGGADEYDNERKPGI